ERVQLMMETHTSKVDGHFGVTKTVDALTKLSCIDCGFTFNKESVQAHTQCVSEQEKYGPKGEGKGNSNSEAKGKALTNQNCDGHLSIGLSTHPPWSCSLCNVKATSRDTLLLHSEGKKHRSKARAVQANKSNLTVKPSLNGNFSVDIVGDNLPSQEPSKNGDTHSEERHEKVEGANTHNSLNKRDNNKQDDASDSNNDPSIGEKKHSKKRKRKEDKARLLDPVSVENKQGWTGQQETDLSDTKEYISDTKGLPRFNSKKGSKGTSRKKVKQTDPEFVQVVPDNKYEVIDDCQRGNLIDDAVKNANRSSKESSNLPVKWKKIIKSVLKSSPNGSLRIKKLQNEVVPLAMKALETAGVSADESHVKDKFMKKVLSSSRFLVHEKIVQLA
ncbi:hypothetical protein KI387_029687, partial [Taxus chinensis]